MLNRSADEREQAEDGGWGAYIPGLPGGVALGASRAEVAERIQEALTAYADDLRDRGRPLIAEPLASRPQLALDAP
jgi:predicted RNase H-like HicB family nuclease